mgnify:CR=1 FL=1
MATKAAKKPTGKKPEGFTEEERGAMKDRARELKAASRRGAGKAEEEAAEVLATIAEMPAEERAIAERLHAILQTHAPLLAPKLWYGMPAYARDGKVVYFFQSAAKFKSRYATLGFSDQANLDDGGLWATAYALVAMTPAIEAKIEALVKQAVR